MSRHQYKPELHWRWNYFLVCVTLTLLGHSQAEYEWNGFVNPLRGRLDYSCPNNSVVTGVASDYSPSNNDRQWEFQCASGAGLANVSIACTLQPAINVLQSDINFDCPNDGYIAGFVSEFTGSSSDRVWMPYCCNRPFSSLVNCQIPLSNWENVLRDNLNYSAPLGYVIAGVESFYFNRDRRWRFRACQVEVNCTDPGIPDNAQRMGSDFLYQDEVVFTCNHGYYQSSGPEGGVRTCLETGLWSDEQPECSLCTNIDNCADIRCTNSSDHTCNLCRSNNGPGLGEAAFTNLGDECEAKCSWLGVFCYPGECPGDPTSCNCTEGFDGDSCLEITDSPALLSCSITLRGADNAEESAECPTVNQTVIYTNIVPNELEAQWRAMYEAPVPPSEPAYVDEFEVGISVSEIRATIYRAANPSQPVTTTTHSCSSPTPTPDAPVPDLIDCTTSDAPSNLSMHTFLHGDTFEVQAYVSTGGHLDIINLDNNQTRTQYYNGTPSIGVATFIIDLLPPVHCSLVSSTVCLINQRLLSLGGEIVQTGTIAVTWGGWVDSPSGVVSYEIDVFHLEESGGLLVEGSRIPQGFQMYQHTGQNTYEHITNLPSEGPFSFILRIIDQAGNIRYSRRLLLFDFTSMLEIDSTVPLQVVSAVPQTQYLWQNSTTDPLIVSGRGHFYNTNLRNVNYLAPVANYTAAVIEPDYDHPLDTGRYPRSGTRNVFGIVQLLYDVIIDREGGRSTESQTQPRVFPFESEDVGIDGIEIHTQLEDGDSVRIWFQVIDFRFQNNYNSVLVHVDSSPPNLQELWLEWNGVTGLNLHGTESLLDLTIQFQTYDQHSGILSVEWSIGTKPYSNNVGSGNVNVQNILDPDTCIPPVCYCDSLFHCSEVQYSFSPGASDFTRSTEALHDTDYFITITITNHAYLTSSLVHPFTVDTTPPLVGSVFDAPPRSPDLDYQAGMTLETWWSGFFDRETDISFYQYIFDSSCVNASYFSHPLDTGSPVIKTLTTSASWEAPGEGTYYITVVAYNSALQPSETVCSDGITVDISPPSFEGVVIPGGVVRPGLAQDGDGRVWFVERNRERWLVDGDIEQCLNRSTVVDLSTYPIRLSTSSSAPIDVCLTASPFASSQPTYLTNEHALNVSWFASDNFRFREFQVGIVEAENFTNSDVGIDYFPTAGQFHFSILNPEILSNGRSFYLSIRAIDLPSNEISINVGPVIVDISPPVIDGKLVVERDGDHVIVTWNETMFSDEEDLNPIVSFKYSIGTSQFGEQIQKILSLPPTPSQYYCSTPYCVAIDTTSLIIPLLSGHAYYFTIEATNSAGLSSFASSTAYSHIAGLPSIGVVYDLDPSLTLGLEGTGLSLHDQDVDVLIDPESLSSRWIGFVHPSLPLTYTVSLGSLPGSNNIVAPISVGTQFSYIFNNVFLEHGVIYYVTVTANNEYGSVNATSDGVLVLRDLNRALLYASVYDGTEDVDTDYQSSSSIAAAQWFFPTPVRAYVTHYKWALFEAVNGNRSNLVEVKSSENVASQTSAITAGVSLLEGVTYISAVHACIERYCLDSVFSDGFQVSIPPVAGTINAIYTPLEWNTEYGTSSYGLLILSWESFIDPQIAFYEWALGTGEPGYELVVYWNQAEWFENQVSVYVNETISLHKRNTVALRGYNTAGLYSMTSASLLWNVNEEVIVQDSVPRSPLIVYDISNSQVQTLETTDWREIEHLDNKPTDLDYINSPDTLSATWPDLRYRTYQYSISSSPAFQSCGSPESLACGETIANSITVTGLSLVNGERYYFCVRAQRDDAILPTPDTPSVLTSCSNGITVDLAAPVGGCVQIVSPSLEARGHTIGSGGEPSGLRPILDNSRECKETNTSRFQSSVSEIHIIWNQFLDVEQSGNAVHAIGVAYYEHSIGTAPGARDVVDFTNVGVATYAVARGLTLQSGTTYYATIRAWDFTGQSSYAVSLGVTIDTTPPILNRVWVEMSDLQSSSLEMKWDPLEELESEIVSTEWGLGSSPGSSDLIEWTIASLESISGAELIDFSHQDGQFIFLSLRVENGAGLSALMVSPGYVLDSSQPLKGKVYDGPQPFQGVSDLDYTTSLSTLHGHWQGYRSGVEYFWSIGTCCFCSDIQPLTTVGSATSAVRNGLSLSNGQTYYIAVQACRLSRCTLASSNGITVDTTPPIGGMVLDSYSGNDIQFQSSRSLISASWIGFHDSQSSIQHFVYFVGLSTNDSSIVPPTTLPASSTSFLIPAPFSLPINRTIYTTVMAYNRAGLYTQASSSGVYIDNTPPVSVGGVSISTEWGGSVVSGTQYSQSVIRVDWEFSDTLTTVRQFFWTLVSDSGVRKPIPPTTAGTQSYDTYTNTKLSDGDSYRALVTACNAAELCTQERSDPVLFDSSPPIDGYFAVSTSSAIDLNRTVPGGMTWRNRPVRGYAQINVAFLGFSDPHSGITEYWVMVGTEFGQSELTDSSQPLLLDASLTSEEKGVSLALIPLNRLLEVNEVIYISLWSVNGVGLRSHIIQASFRIDPIPELTNNGTLTVLRSSSCPIETCMGHCTCAARGDLCSVETAAACQELNPTTLATDLQLRVFNVPQTSQDPNNDVLFTAVTDKLLGRWEFVNPSSNAFRLLEWSVSEQGSPPGTGLVDTLSGPIWRATGSAMTAVFSVSQSYPLRNGSTYVFHVRAWYSNNTYAVFTSSGITVDTIGPQIERGLRVREGEQDVDFVSSDSTVELFWRGVFLQTYSSNYSRYEIAIGDTPGSDNVFPFTLVSSMSTSIRETGLMFRHGRKYYSTVRALSPLGIVTDSISDGFRVDLTPPNIGQVLNGIGIGYSSITAQYSISMYSCRWFGFNDPESNIHHYEISITDSQVQSLESEYQNIGIGLKTTLTGLSLVDGETYFAHIVSVNNAGSRSQDALSTGVVIDTTRPAGYECTSYSANSLSNPSFEGLTTQPTDTPCPASISLQDATNSWTLSTSHTSVISSLSVDISSYDGCFSLYFIGTISQNFPTTPGSSYRLTFSLHRGRTSAAVSVVRVTMPGIDRTLELRPLSEGSTLGGWERFEFVFSTEVSTSLLTFSTVSEGYGVVVDGVSITGCTNYVELPSADIVVQWPNAIHVNQDYISRSATRIIANWDIQDPESGIREYQWAIGTTPRGEQLQRYTSTGNTAQGVSGELELRHGEGVYISVVAWNNAGLERVVYSRGYTVDLTPPVIVNGSGVLDGLEEDLDYQSNGVISADWSGIIDSESGIASCRWAIGSNPGSFDIQSFMILPPSNTSASSSDLTNSLTDGQTVFSTVICTNGAGLQTTSHSDGVTILRNPPISIGSNVFAFVSSPELTQFESRNGYISSSSLVFTWGGFIQIPPTPLTYEVRLVEEGVSGNWTDVGCSKSITFSDLQQLSHNVSGHAVQVRAVNPAGLSSEPLIRNFTIVPTHPQDSGSQINTTWLTETRLQIEWGNKFVSATPLYYELSLGTQMGSSSIERWVELSTQDTSYTVTSVRLRRNVDYFIALTAISSSGLHTTVSQLESGMPVTG